MYAANYPSYYSAVGHKPIEAAGKDPWWKSLLPEHTRTLAEIISQYSGLSPVYPEVHVGTMYMLQMS